MRSHMPNPTLLLNTRIAATQPGALSRQRTQEGFYTQLHATEGAYMHIHTHTPTGGECRNTRACDDVIIRPRAHSRTHAHSLSSTSAGQRRRHKLTCGRLHASPAAPAPGRSGWRRGSDWSQCHRWAPARTCGLSQRVESELSQGQGCIGFEPG